MPARYRGIGDIQQVSIRADNGDANRFGGAEGPPTMLTRRLSVSGKPRRRAEPAAAADGGRFLREHQGGRNHFREHQGGRNHFRQGQKRLLTPWCPPGKALAAPSFAPYPEKEHHVQLGYAKCGCPIRDEGTHHDPSTCTNVARGKQRGRENKGVGSRFQMNNIAERTGAVDRATLLLSILQPPASRPGD
jgi:hypothetical protein